MMVKPYKASLVGPQDFPIDYYGFIAVIFGVFGAMLSDTRFISMAMMFGITSLMTNYLGVSPRAIKTT
ncbi:hypothetical protein KY285_020799 [Solanum tuberosum]|nr:hypothetical protein KY289_021045 [Solanum tuberosum]KAH0693702.1 hypothetical protein KY285_020799 [Solanum tuberosum]